jgi:5-methylthioadenosine/S-adenosylhomocysteine deaminase
MPGADPHQPPVVDVLVEGSTIVWMGPVGDAGPADVPAEPGVRTTEIAAAGKLVIPGFVNAHYHSHDLLAKGLFEELPLEIWGLYSLPDNYSRLTIADVRARTLLGALECLRNGITTVQDMLSLFPAEDAYLDTVLDAYDEIGLRVVLSLQVSDVSAKDSVPHWRDTVPPEVMSKIDRPPRSASSLLDLVENPLKVRKTTQSRLSWALGPSGPQRCTRELLEGLADLGERYRLPVITHLYETKPQAVQARMRYGDHGGSLVRYLEDTGLLGPRLTVAHAIWITRDEMELLGASGAGAILNPVSNMKLKSGIPPAAELRAAGVRLALGCDNCSGSDVQSMIQAMKTHCLLQAVSDPEPKPGHSPAVEAIRMATEGGSCALGLGAQVGRIEPGMKADLVILDLEDPAFLPFNSAARQLVYSEVGRSIETVIIDGRIVMHERRIQTIDEEALRREIHELGARFRTEFADVTERNADALSYLTEAHRRSWRADVGMNRYALFLDE